MRGPSRLGSTGQLSVDAAIATIEDVVRECAELRSAEAAFGTALWADGWRSVAAEAEASPATWGSGCVRLQVCNVRTLPC